MMRRQENQAARPTAGCISVPLFNQKKRNRIPLTSSPSVNEFFSHTEYVANTSAATSHNSTAGTHGGYQASGLSSGASQSDQWNRRGVPQAPQPRKFTSNRPAPEPAATTRTYAPISHPYKAGGTGSKAGQPSYPSRQQDYSFTPPRQNKYQAPSSSDTAQSKTRPPHGGFSHAVQQSPCRPRNPSYQQQQQPRPLLPPVPPVSKSSARAVQPPQNNSWAFTNSFGPQSSSSNPPRTTQPTQSQAGLDMEASLMKPAPENSLRILTAVIAGMRHWSQLKDKVPYLFEIFATLDSAVTLGHHGAKTFLMRDGKQVVQCIFYENEKELPRLIRGQIHRCVGNYDRSRDVLVCVSVRPGLPSEHRNALEAVQACDTEMRALVKSLREV
ncbi:spermatogenesis-associated protein 22 [Solea solea]|uniref:spermatogenesis-associated protein 22 n=1 Tax=Solea solea TaxID=90069 RepID=UPI00272D3C47|nr:spermatogenesis-associated protein 22 [Solea solea]XP_058484022.1 spermatogenesis-associated protein 22 [Solea solea]